MVDEAVAAIASAGIALDARGYLLDAAQWTPELADAMARRDGIELGTEHWEILHFLRDYHQRFAMAPPMRLLVKEIGKQFAARDGGADDVGGVRRNREDAWWRHTASRPAVTSSTGSRARRP